MMINIFVDHHIYIYVVIVTSSSGQVLSTNGGRVGAMYTGLINSSPAPEYLNKFIQRMENWIKTQSFVFNRFYRKHSPLTALLGESHLGPSRTMMSSLTPGSGAFEVWVRCIFSNRSGFFSLRKFIQRHRHETEMQKLRGRKVKKSSQAACRHYHRVDYYQLSWSLIIVISAPS